MLKNDLLKVSGLNDEYIVDDILLTPFPKNFMYKDNICVFYTTLFNDKIDRVYFIAEYFENFNQESLKDISYRGFSPNGVLFIKCSEENIKSVVDDIKANKRDFKQSLY